jgi:hypothetical protein
MLAVCAPAPVTRELVSESSASFAGTGSSGRLSDLARSTTSSMIMRPYRETFRTAAIGGREMTPRVNQLPPQSLVGVTSLPR